MSTTETLETAIEHLGSFSFVGCVGAGVVREVLSAEVSRCADWFQWSDGFIELYPSKEAVRLAELSLQLKGVDVVSPEDIVIEALTILDMGRVDGRLPGRSVNNYMTLKYALEHGDCEDWGVIGMAKGIIFAFRGEFM